MMPTTDDFLAGIITALSKRDFVYQRVTNGIAKKIDFVFEAIIEHLNQNALEIEWESIDISSDLLVVVARIPNEQITQRRVLSVGIPLDIVKTQSKDKVLDFFINTEATKAMREKELADFVNQAMESGNISSALSDLLDDVDDLDEFGDNNVAMESYKAPKRILH